MVRLYPRKSCFRSKRVTFGGKTAGKCNLFRVYRRAIDANATLLHKKFTVALQGLHAVPADTFVIPPDADQMVALHRARGVVVRTRDGVGIVLAVQRHGLCIVGVPADTLVVPAHGDEMVTLHDARRVVVVAGVGVIESIHW